MREWIGGTNGHGEHVHQSAGLQYWGILNPIQLTIKNRLTHPEVYVKDKLTFPQIDTMNLRRTECRKGQILLPNRVHHGPNKVSQHDKEGSILNPLLTQLKPLCSN